MPIPVEVVFRHAPKSELLEREIRERVDRLAQRHSRLHSCRVVLDQVPAHSAHPHCFEVGIGLRVPGNELEAHARSERAGQAASLSGAVHAAFEAANRRLADHSSRRRAH